MNTGMSTEPQQQNQDIRLCGQEDLVPNSGVCALWQDQQIAIFYLPEDEPSVYAVSNWDPIGKAEVISRGILGDIEGTKVVASPLYKQHFDLTTGRCFEDENHSLEVFQVVLEKDGLWLKL